MKQDILKLIAAENDLTHVFILTHNIDYFFLQSQVLPVLRKCGHPNLTIFADANCAFESFQRQGDLLHGIGRYYRVIPVDLGNAFRFHPKAILLCGKSRGSLFIGSGNLSFGGWRENSEIWIQYYSDEEGNPIKDFYQYLKEVTGYIPLNLPILNEIDNAFDSKNHPWFDGLRETNTVLSKPNNINDSLMQQFLKIIENQNINQLYICTPYFDSEGKILREIAGNSKAEKIDVLIQEGKSNLLESAKRDLPANIHLKSIQFKSEEESNRLKFIHAKFYAFISDNIVTVFTGSANCSVAALGLPGRKGNAELMVIQRLSIEEFENNYLNDIEISEKEPKLIQAEEILQTEIHQYKIKILACRLEGEELKISYSTEEAIEIIRCLVDSNQIDFEKANENEITVICPFKPSRVVLQGFIDGETVLSPESWIDDEYSLRFSSSQKKLIESLTEKGNSKNFTIDSFNEIIELVINNLNQRAHYYSSFKPKEDKKEGDGKVITFTEEDVFSKNYGLASFHSNIASDYYQYKHQGFFNLILEWFNARQLTEQPKKDDEDPDRPRETDEDVPEDLPQKEDAKKGKIEESEKRKLKNIIKRLAAIVTHKDFISQRPAEQLGVDLRIIPLLLRKGLNEDWISLEDFSTVSCLIWSKLFFSIDDDSIPKDKFSGWIDYRYQQAEDENIFKAELASFELAASLALWALSIPPEIDSAEQAVFKLACSKSIALFPWLWHIENPNLVAEKLSAILIHTDIKFEHEKDWKDVQYRWKKIIQQGLALKELESILSDVGLGDIIKCLDQEIVHKGELLWQSKKFGLCIAGEDCDRTVYDRKIDVLCLQYGTSKKFNAKYLFPVANFLDSNSKLIDKLSVNKKEVLMDFTNSLRSGLITDI